MRLRIYSLLFLITVLSGACKETPTEKEDSFLASTFKKNLKVKADTKWVIILPGLGCHGCIQDAEAFVKDNLHRKDMMFVLTNISSLKILQQKLEIKLTDFSNIYVDKDNQFLVPTDNKMYPCIVKVEKEKVVSHEFQCPQNGNALVNLQKLLSSNK